MRLAESGLVGHWRKKVTPRTERCNPEIRSDGDDDRKILSLADLSGPFILLICGCTLSFFVYLIERLYHRYCTVATGRGNWANKFLIGHFHYADYTTDDIRTILMF